MDGWVVICKLKNKPCAWGSPPLADMLAFIRGYAEGSSKIAHKVLSFLWDNECYLTDQNSAIFNIFNNSSYFNYYDYLLYYKYEKGK
jgi:hypothetical protein